MDCEKKLSVVIQAALMLISIQVVLGSCEREAIDANDPWAPCGQNRFCSSQRDICKDCSAIEYLCHDATAVLEQYPNCSAYCASHREQTKCAKEKESLRNDLDNNMANLNDTYQEEINQARKEVGELRKKNEELAATNEKLTNDLTFLNATVYNNGLQIGILTAERDQYRESLAHVTRLLNETQHDHPTAGLEVDHIDWLHIGLLVLVVVVCLVSHRKKVVKLLRALKCCCRKGPKKTSPKHPDGHSAEMQPLAEESKRVASEEGQTPAGPAEPSSNENRPEPSAPADDGEDSGRETDSIPGSATPDNTPGSTPRQQRGLLPVRPDNNYPTSVVIQPTTDDKSQSPTYAIGHSSLTVALHSIVESPLL